MKIDELVLEAKQRRSIQYPFKKFLEEYLQKVRELQDQKGGQVDLRVIPKIAEGKRRFTEEEEKYIWWGVQWAFKPENKNRIFKQKDFFDYVYYEMEV